MRGTKFIPLRPSPSEGLIPFILEWQQDKETQRYWGDGATWICSLKKKTWKAFRVHFMLKLRPTVLNVRCYMLYRASFNLRSKTLCFFDKPTWSCGCSGDCGFESCLFSPSRSILSVIKTSLLWKCTITDFSKHFAVQFDGLMSTKLAKSV